MSRLCSLGCWTFWMLVLGCAWGADVARGEESLAVFPSSLKISSNHARPTLVAQHVRDGENVGSVDVSAAGKSKVEWISADPKVVEVVGGQLTPRGNGQTTVTVKVDGKVAVAQITVEKFEKPYEVSFRNQVQSVLTKTGCNMGACHGSAAGKNGLKLSLRAYDDEFDYFSITRQARGRRIVPSDPARSLMVLKPTGTIAHKGGVRFEVGSPEYEAVVDWIAQGAKPPKADDPSLVKLELFPSQSKLAPGTTQQFVVLAHFSDGHTEDVTRWAKYTSTNESVITIDELGKAKVVGQGEGTITAWYLSQLVISSVTSPYDQKVDKQLFATSPKRNFIDELVLEKLERLNLPPSPRGTDVEFLRRAYLDTIGVLPTPDEVTKFLADPSPNKRDRVIDSLLNRPEFVDYWSYKWADLLLVNSERLTPDSTWAYYRWIREQVSENVPWDKLVHKLITAQGETLENGAANFFVLHKEPADLTETVSQAFLGMSMNCAKCHNHPMEKWTNDQYYGMANLFARVKTKQAQTTGAITVFSVDQGDLIQPRTGKPQPPQALEGPPLDETTGMDRREFLANWLTSPTNPYFSRTITNRIWANFMSVGLVEAVDDLRLTNPASNEELLNRLAKYLVDNQYDMKRLMKLILQSETYQRSSTALKENEADRRYYSRYYPRRLMAEVLLDAVSQATGSPTQFDGYAAGWRALQLPDSNVTSYFLKSFGRPMRQLTCECERTDEPSMVQVLHISNGDTINKKLSSNDNFLSKSLQAKKTDAQLLEDAYLRCLSRLPTPEEKERLLAAMAKLPSDQRRQTLEDLYWGLLSSKEFLFNH